VLHPLQAGSGSAPLKSARCQRSGRASREMVYMPKVRACCTGDGVHAKGQGVLGSHGPAGVSLGSLCAPVPVPGSPLAPVLGAVRGEARGQWELRLAGGAEGVAHAPALPGGCTGRAGGRLRGPRALAPAGGPHHGRHAGRGRSAPLLPGGRNLKPLCCPMGRGGGRNLKPLCCPMGRGGGRNLKPLCCPMGRGGGRNLKPLCCPMGRGGGRNLKPSLLSYGQGWGPEPEAPLLSYGQGWGPEPEAPLLSYGQGTCCGTCLTLWQGLT